MSEDGLIEEETRKVCLGTRPKQRLGPSTCHFFISSRVVKGPLEIFTLPFLFLVFVNPPIFFSKKKIYLSKNLGFNPRNAVWRHWVLFKFKIIHA